VSDILLTQDAYKIEPGWACRAKPGSGVGDVPPRLGAASSLARCRCDTTGRVEIFSFDRNKRDGGLTPRNEVSGVGLAQNCRTSMMDRLTDRKCQTALNWDPGSASNRNPSRALEQACPGSQREDAARSGATATSLA
jgi:hypothetical protein